MPAGSGTLALLTIYLTAFHFDKTLDALADLPFTWGACGVLLLGLKRDHTRLLRTGRTNSTGFLPFYGYISYGLYLVNVLVYMKLGGVLQRHTQPAALRNFGVWGGEALVCIGVSTGIAWLARRFFEGPILGLKEKWQDRFAKPTLPVAVAVPTPR